MPTYDYHCEPNSRTRFPVAAQHESSHIENWGELCRRAGMEPGTTPVDTPVERIISGGIALPIASAAPTLPMAGCCGHPSSCGHHH